MWLHYPGFWIKVVHLYEFLMPFTDRLLLQNMLWGDRHFWTWGWYLHWLNWSVHFFCIWDTTINMYFGKLVLNCEIWNFFCITVVLHPPLPSPPLPHTHTPHLTSSFQTVSMQCDTVLIHRLKYVPELVKVGRERERREREEERGKGGRKRRGGKGERRRKERA